MDAASAVAYKSFKVESDRACMCRIRSPVDAVSLVGLVVKKDGY